MSRIKKDKPRIGISACLLGQPVRYNRGQTHQKWLTRELSRHVDFIPFCPEMEMGLGVPREEMHLYLRNDGSVGIKTKRTEKDMTHLVEENYQKIHDKLLTSMPDGLILMRKSPSCAPSDVVAMGEDQKIKFTSGLFAEKLMQDFPHLPIIDSGKIQNEELREIFLKKVWAHFRFENLEPKISQLQDFHKRYKFVLLEHHQIKMRQLGDLAANRNNEQIHKIFEDYKSLFFTTLSMPPKTGNRIDSMAHILGFIKKDLSSTDKIYMAELLNNFKMGKLPYQVPLHIIKFLIHKYDIEYLKDHYIFSPALPS